jgi:NodT family efflux transporter outer membrane factor (OMF) lipoprotein
MMKNRYRESILFLSLVMGLTACSTLGPDYRQPQISWLDKWQPELYVTESNEAEQQELDLRFWWQLFNDPDLNQLIELAKQQNLDLRITGLRILESHAQLGIAGSTLYPQFQQINTDITALETSRKGGVLPDDSEQLINYQAGFGLGWELDFWGKFKRSIESADAAFLNSIANYQHMQVLLCSQIAELYFSYRVTEKRMAIAQHNAEIQKRSFQITEKIYLEGQGSELDLQQAKSQYLGTLSTIPSLKISLIRTRNALANLLALPPGTVQQLTPNNLSLPTADTSVLKDIPANILLRRPDIRAAAWQVAAQSAQIGIAETDFYPSISLVGSLSWSSDSLSATPDSSLLGLGPSLRWNVFDHGRITNNVRVQDVRLQQLIESYQNTVLAAAREIDDAAISLVESRKQMTILKESVQASKRALDIANTRYQEGYSSFERVLDSQRAVFTLTEQELISQGSHISAIISMYKGLGGGWIDTSINEIIPSTLRDSMEKRTDWGGLLDTPLPLNSALPTSNSGK